MSKQKYFHIKSIWSGKAKFVVPTQWKDIGDYLYSLLVKRDRV